MKKRETTKAKRKGWCLKQHKILAPYYGVTDLRGKIWVATWKLLREPKEESLVDFKESMQRRGWKAVRVTVTED